MSKNNMLSPLNHQRLIFILLSFFIQSCLSNHDPTRVRSPLPFSACALPPPPPPPPNILCTAPPPPPPPSGCPLPLPLPPPPRRHSHWPRRRPFLSESKAVLGATRELRQNITHDPNGYAKTWVGPNYCRYKGYFCEAVPDRNATGLAGVVLNGALLGGATLDVGRYVQNLPDVAVFHANSNNLTGAIPLAISKLRFLYELDVSNNRLAGAFPTAVLGAQKLTFLDLRYNSFSGPIPTGVFLLDLDVLFLNNNKFSGSIPNNLGDTPARYVTFANNEFAGGIPPSIGRAPNLQEVLFLNNRMEGCLPYEVGLLNRATVFDIWSNRIRGPVPASFGCLEKMERLNLGRNQLFGAVPETVCMLRRLYNFSVAYNYLTQVGPHCRRLIEAGVMDARMNCILDLPEQRSKEDCEGFFEKRKFCPSESSFSIVPCEVPPAAADTGNGKDFRAGRALTPSPTYGALNPTNDHN